MKSVIKILPILLFLTFSSNSFSATSVSKYIDVDNCILTSASDVTFYGETKPRERIHYTNLKMVSTLVVVRLQDKSTKEYSLKFDIPSGGELNHYFNEDKKDDFVDAYKDCIND